MDFEFWVRWYWVGLFALIALMMGILGRRLGRPSAIAHVAGLDPSCASRLEAAVARRAALDAGANGPITAWIAGASLLSAFLCAFTQISPPLLYSMLNVVIAGSMANRYFHLRRAGTRRIASLRARDRSAVFPAWILVTTAIAVLSPLGFIDIVPVASILVATAAVTTALIGLRAVDLPALLSGEDPPVDEYVDDQVRGSRAMMLVGGATSSASLFNLFTLTTAQTAPSHFWMHALAVIAASGAVFAEGLWQAIAARRAGADLKRWLQVGV